MKARRRCAASCSGARPTTRAALHAFATIPWQGPRTVEKARASRGAGAPAPPSRRYHRDVNEA